MPQPKLLGPLRVPHNDRRRTVFALRDHRPVGDFALEVKLPEGDAVTHDVPNARGEAAIVCVPRVRILVWEHHVEYLKTRQVEVEAG